MTTVAGASQDVPAAVFSALTHSRGPEAGAILEALAGALNTIHTETAEFLAEFTEVGLGDTDGQRIWKVLMATVTYPYTSSLRSQGREEGRAEGLEEGRAEGRAEGLEEGRAEGQAKSRATDILRILERRGIAVDSDARQRIESCGEYEILGTWLDRSLTAEKASDLFS